MRHHFLFIAALPLAFACADAMAQSAEQTSALGDLSKLMADIHANPAKARTARCPSNTGKLAGLPLGSVIVELGQPDPHTKQDANAVAYPMGSGGPVVTFRFDKQGLVTSVECKRA